MPSLKGEIKVVFHAVGPNYNNNLLFFYFVLVFCHIQYLVISKSQLKCIYTVMRIGKY